MFDALFFSAFEGRYPVWVMGEFLTPFIMFCGHALDQEENTGDVYSRILEHELG